MTQIRLAHGPISLKCAVCDRVLRQSYHGGSIVFSGRLVLRFFWFGMILVHDNLMRGFGPGPGPDSLMINQRLKLFEITILDNYLFDQITLISKETWHSL